ncbi:MAG TPA: response regulator [Candidatus Acidoferrum sp.]|jgi:two-component system vancomycin resistance associated response regulator VraR
MPKQILVVDDQEYIRRVVRAFIEESRELQVCGEAVDGMDALVKAEQLHPDLIILDLSMPRMNGIQAAARLKKMLPRTPIVLFTSHCEALGGWDTRSAGIDTVVAKDGQTSQLVERVQRLLEAAA